IRTVSIPLFPLQDTNEYIFLAVLSTVFLNCTNESSFDKLFFFSFIILFLIDSDFILGLFSEFKKDSKYSISSLVIGSNFKLVLLRFLRLRSRLVEENMPFILSIFFLLTSRYR